ncbi:hypothetical protein [Rhodopirellula sallentina]|uniref:Uncharacterized protein n=1 Tax=Rhodopirellula sallentina SM41 TaxID=1263870 RepID=M5UCE8_9BACT|nr:hypothetical protein [Rhodopirellula sallentina]EMI53673.1 hypothetical protein RSSM_04889 [Rhodopirellula sallentina SM41]
MSTSRALSSFVTFATDEQFRKDHLKFCALWYDEVLYETIGKFNQDKFIDSLVENEKISRKFIRELSDLFVPLAARVEADVIEELRNSEPHGYPRWGEKHENYNYPEPESAEEFAHNCLLERIASQHGVDRITGHAIEHAEGRARVAVNAVRTWQLVNREIPCMLQANPDEKLAMTAVRKYGAGNEEVTPPIELLEASVPSLSAVPWSQVLQFRRDGSLESLRSKISEAMQLAGKNIDAAKRVLADLESTTIDQIVDSARPNPRKVIIESAAANVPGWLFNPASLSIAMRDVSASQKNQRELGWLYLLRDIRSAASPDS